MLFIREICRSDEIKREEWIPANVKREARTEWKMMGSSFIPKQADTSTQRTKTTTNAQQINRLLAAGVLGDTLGTFRNGMLG